VGLMELNFKPLVTQVKLGDHDVEKVHDIWFHVFGLADGDEDYIWNERLNDALGKFRALVDDTHSGAILFGESAAHIFRSNEALHTQMAKFRNRFLTVNADARQAFNDSLGLLGQPGN